MKPSPVFPVFSRVLTSGGLALLFLSGCNSEPSARQVPKPAPTSKESADSPSNIAWFRELSPKDSGLHFTYSSGHQTDFLFPEIVGGGAALFDLENDGDLDIYLVQGGRLAESQEPAQSDQLFRNDGNLKFTNVTQAAGLHSTDYGMGVAAGDYDRDGLTDLLVTHVGGVRLLRNRGTGNFEEVTSAAGLQVTGWPTSAAFFDADQDGDLDLYLCHYVRWDIRNELKCFKKAGVPDYCAPEAYNSPEPDSFFRNRGDGTFEDHSESSGIRTTAGNGLGVIASDFDGDGDQDLFVANDMTPNLLWVNDGSGHFSEQAMQAGCGVDRDGRVKAGMGVALGDLRGIGLLDLIVVNLQGQSDSLFENQGGWFIDRTTQRGLAMASRPFTRFGVGLHDFNLDSHLDLFLANGGISVPEDPQAVPFAEPNLLLQGGGEGKFTPISAAAAGPVTAVATSRGAAFGDLNNDGGLDIVVVNRDSPTQILINNLPADRPWLGLELRSADGTVATGATCRITQGERTWRRDVNPNYSYLCSSDHRVQVGLATSDPVTVTVTWPDRSVETFGPLRPGEYVRLKAGDGQTR